MACYFLESGLRLMPLPADWQGKSEVEPANEEPSPPLLAENYYDNIKLVEPDE
ncbi:MAG: hypothetical protein PHY02_10880 [Phycisphaerae bacterium]|nr:hypothetical protein [Phycisphaerae bacterium]